MKSKSPLRIAGIIILVIFLLSLAALIGGLIFLKNFDIKKYKPQIIQAAGQSLGRPVDFKDIDLKVSLDKGIRLHLTEFAIAEDPDFGSRPFATVAEIDAGIDIIPFLASRQISLPSVLIRSPRIEIVRNAAGLLNVETIGRPEPGSPVKTEDSPSPAAALPAVLVNSFKIEDAAVYFIDQASQPEIKLGVTQLALNVRRFSLTHPFTVELEAALLSAQKNFRASGKVQLQLMARGARVSIRTSP